MSTLISLDDTIRRFGTAVLSDPTALRDALSTADIRPADEAIAALTETAATPALAWMRGAAGQVRDPERTLAVGVDATRAHGRSIPAGLPAARWACIQFGAATGLLPREWAATDLPPVPGRGPSRRRGAMLAGAAAAAVMTVAVVAAAAVGVIAQRGVEPVPVSASGPAPAEPSAAPAPVTPVRHPDYSGTSTADPRTAFRDPDLLALAEPYLTARGADCAAQDPSGYYAERVLCYLGSGRVAAFKKAVSTDVLRRERSAVTANVRGTARAGTIHASRWAFVAERPGVKTDIADAGAGDGMRIRWTTTKGYRDLYFDQDSTGASGLISIRSADPGQADPLHDYWAEPSR
jgi:hypothetical protein